MTRLVSTKYTGKSSIHEHIMEIRDITVQLNDINVSISYAFLVHFILTSLPSEYDLFKVFNNTHNEDWTVNKLLIICVQEEERLRGEKTKNVNLASHQISGKIDNKKIDSRQKERRH